MITDSKKIFTDGRNIFLGGVSHVGRDKSINQDAFRIGVKADKGIAYTIVADGLGSCRKSDQGAKRIIEIIESWILNQLENYAFLSNNVASILTKYIVEEWVNSYSTDEIFSYDTTVHVAIYYQGSMLIGGIGDGMALLKYDSIIAKDCIEEKDFFSNVTSSMCSLEANTLIKFEIVPEADCKEKIVSILATDGIADDLIPKKKLTLLDYFVDVIENNGQDMLQTELKEWIEDWETELHSDDKTLCYMIVLEGKTDV